MARPTPETWTRTARAIHWGTALAVLVEVPAGFTMAWTYLDGLRHGPLAGLHLRASQVHHTLGLLLLASVAVRLAWRWRHPAPALPDSVGKPSARAARAVQGLLYLLLALLPLTGWAALSALAGSAEYPAPELWFFAHDGFGPGVLIPHLVAPQPWNAPPPLNYGTLARAHRWLVYAGGAVLALHVAAALKHHVVDRDGVLSRMLRGPDR